MHYYEHHLGDYAEATSHLSFVEDAAYSRCIRKYYSIEAALPADIKAVQRLVGARSKEEKDAVEAVLKEFFTLGPDGWHNARCDEEIARYTDKRQKAKRSASARWIAKPSDNEGNANASEVHTEGIADAMRSQSEGNAKAMLSNLQSPISNPQSPRKKKGASATRFVPPFDPQAVPNLDLEAWKEWVAYRAERKPAIKPASLQAAAEELAAFGEQQSAVVRHSKAQGYQGLFPPKANGSARQPAYRPTKSADELEAEAIARGENPWA